MPDFIVIAPGGRGTLGAGIAAGASITRRGEVILMPWHVQLSMEGKMFTAGMGTITTPVSNPLTTLDITKPQMSIQAPQGTTIIPMEILIYTEATGGSILECNAMVADNAPGNGTSSALDRPIANLKPRGPGSLCTGRQVITTTPTYSNQNEFWRGGEPARLDQTSRGNSQDGFRWSYLKNGAVPIIVGPGTLNVTIACGTSSSSFLTIIWAEFNTADLGLS